MKATLAQILIPSFSPSVGAVNRPPVFDGKTPWDAYLMQFQMLAQINGLTDAQKATYLTASLKGPALTVLSNLPAGLDTRSGWNQEIFVLGDESFVGNGLLGMWSARTSAAELSRPDPGCKDAREQRPAKFCKAKLGCGTPSLNRH